MRKTFSGQCRRRARGYRRNLRAYDAFTFTSMLQLEDYGFCKKGEGGEYVLRNYAARGGGPITHPVGHLCEGYTHGMNMVIENVRQLRRDVDDFCPIGPNGKRQHSHDYREGGCLVRSRMLKLPPIWGGRIR